MNNRQTVFIALIFLATIVACVVPGLPTASAPISAPTIDTGRLETMVAETVSAAIAQTEQSQPTSMPLPTFTITPTSDSALATTPAPTTTPAFTATPAPAETATATANPSQSTLTKQGDGLMLFVDERAGYEIKLPAGWLSMRINGPEYSNISTLPEANNINVQQSLLSIQNENPNVFRLLAIDIQAAHIQNEFVSDMRFVLDESKNISLSSDADLQAIAKEIPTTAAVFRFEVTSVKIITSASGTQFGVIEAKSSFTNTTSADVTVLQKQVFFNVKAGRQSITLTTLSDLKETILPIFDATLETIKITAK